MLLFKRKTYNDILYEWLNSKKDEVKESSYYVHASLDYKRTLVDTFNCYLPC